MDTQLLEKTRLDAEPAMEPVGATVSALEHATSVFVDARPQLFKIAYRVLGSVGEAEDVVQEAWIRWQSTDRAAVQEPPAFLATTTTRLAINVAQSARKRHEAQAGPLPDLVAGEVGPDAEVERRHEVDTALLLLMEKLTPTERAAYVLREAFAYPYRQIADVLRLGVANARQLVRRARLRLATEQRAPVSSASHRRLVRAFLAATQTGDLADLEHLLATEAAGSSRSVRLVNARR